MNNKLAALVGPTATGKTGISLQLAQRLNAEIVSCDSMQVYKYLNIGTAKAGQEQRKAVPHHLVDLVEPSADFSVAKYQQLAQIAIDDINCREKLPLLVGGTGLYYQAVVDDYRFHPVAAKSQVRAYWQEQAAIYGLSVVYEKLKLVDPVYADKIGIKDEKRMIRALEVYDLTGKPFSEQQQKQGGKYKLCLAGLYLERNILYQRINQRVDDMLNQGLIEEVSQLRDLGYSLDNTAMQALGYKQVLYYLNGFIDREQMVNEIKKETRRFAKRQLTWFRKDKRIRWFDLGKYREQDEAVQEIAAYMEGQFS